MFRFQTTNPRKDIIRDELIHYCATTQRTTLYYREGSNDKEYQAAIEPEGDLFLVTFAFGRRGSTLSTGTKTGAETRAMIFLLPS